MLIINKSTYIFYSQSDKYDTNTIYTEINAVSILL